MNCDYSKTLIYRVACKDPEVPDSYLGYTTFSLVYVSNMFKVRCKNDTWHVCEFIRQNGGLDNWYFERLDCKPCLTSLDARTELRKHFDASPPTLNRQLPTQTPKEYARGDKNKAVQKEYRAEHREQIQLEQHAQYQKNRERLLIKRREYYLDNREICNARVRALRARRKAARLEATS